MEDDPIDEWLSLGPQIDTDLFLKSGAAVQDELINGTLSDWAPELGWEWGDGVNGDEGDDAASNAEESDDETDVNADDVARFAVPTPAAAVVVTHTPLVRRKPRPTADTVRDDRELSRQRSNNPHELDTTRVFNSKRQKR